MDKVNLRDKLALFDEPWCPHIIAELNGQEVKVAKLHGEFDWHHHDEADELFLVVHGTIDIELRDRTVTLDPGELLVVPRGVEHRPVAREEAHVLLFEPAGTRNTGNRETARTVDAPKRI